MRRPSRYPLHGAFGSLGLALIAAERGVAETYAATAVRVAEVVGIRLAAQRARELLPAREDPLREVFFC